ncbi:MAG: hypothetical protein IMW99_07070 [Firmicutes bacterium]|nr:hypothetical protein [Bacillota bacterium]
MIQRMLMRRERAWRQTAARWLARPAAVAAPGLWGLALAVAGILAWGPSPEVSAQDLTLGGRLQVQVGVPLAGTDSQLVDPSTELRLKLDNAKDQGAFHADLVFREDGAQPLPPSWNLRTAYGTVNAPSWELSFGKQVVAWGNTDLFNPVNVLNPDDLSNPTKDPADMKLPVLMTKFTYYPAPGGDTSLQAVVVPVFTPSLLPEPGSYWAPPAPEYPQAIPVQGALVPVSRVENPEISLPAATPENAAVGLRLGTTLPVLGGSQVAAVYYHGHLHTPTPVLQVEPDPTASQQPSVILKPALHYDPVNTFGAEFSTSVAGIGLSSTVGYSLTPDKDGTDPNTANPSGMAVVEASYVFANGLNLSAEVAESYAKGDRGQADQWTTQTGLLLMHQPTDRLTWQTALLYNVSDKGGVIRPQVQYTLTDGVTATLAAFAFFGPENSQLGGYHDKSLATLSLSCAF